MLRLPFSLSSSRSKFILSGAVSALLGGSLAAANVNLINPDAAGTTSFNTGPNWSDATAPSALNDYFVTGISGTPLTLRTPTSGAHTFAGNSLTLNPFSIMAFKTAGVITINNLILNGGELNNFDVGGDQIARVAGTITITAASRINSSTTPRAFSISALIQGTGGLTTAGGGGPITLTNTGNTFTGPLNLTETTALAVNGIANGGIASALGASSSAAENIILTGGTLRVIGAGGSTDRLFTMNTSGGIDSSGTGVVNFTNTGAIVHGGTTARTLTLNGSNTGNNIFAPLLTDGPLATGLQKNGNGTWIVTNANTYTGNTTINNGILRITQGSSLGANGTMVNINGNTGGNGILELTGGITLNKNFTLTARQGATFDIPHIRSLNGNNVITGTVGGTTGGSEYNVESAALGGLLTINGNVNLSSLTSGLRNLKLMGAGDGILNGQLVPGTGSAVTSLFKQGSGTWTLNGPAPHNGGTIVQGGTLALGATSSLSGTNLIEIGAGAQLNATALGGLTLNSFSTLRGSGTLIGNVTSSNGVTIAPGTTTTAGTLSINGDLNLNGGEVIALNVGNANTAGGGVNDLISVSGTLNRVGDTVIEFHPIGSALGGSYRLINFTGAGSTTGAFTFLNNTRYNLATETATAGQVNLVVTGSAGNLVWSGTTSVDWSTGATGNWNAGAENFFEADNVTFNDSTASTTINLVGTVLPGSITVNAAQDYTFGGAGSIGGATGLVKSGTGVLTVSTANTFNGAVTVNAGTLRVGNVAALGTTAGGTTVNSGATLDLNGLVLPVGETITISGSGVGGLGAVVSSGLVAGGIKKLVLAGNSTVGGSGRWDIRDVSGGLEGGGHTLTKVGVNEIWLTNIGETHLGNVVISEGNLGFEGNTTMGDAPGLLQVAAAGILGFFNSNVPHSKNVEFQGGRIAVGAGAANTLGGGILLSGGLTVDPVTGSSVALTGAISGSGELTKINTGTLEIGGTVKNTFTGTTTLSAGTLRLAKPSNTDALGGDLVYTGGTLTFVNTNQLADTATVTNSSGVNLTIGDETFLNAVVNTTAGGQIIANNGVTVTNLVTVNGAGVYSAASNSTSSARGVQLNSGFLRVAANTGPTTLNIGVGGIVAAGGTIEVGLGTGNHDAVLNLSGNLTTSGDLLVNDGGYSGPNLRQINLVGARTLEIGDATTTTVNADFAGSGSLIKAGAGTLVFAPRSLSTFTGGAEVNNGTLLVNGSLSGSTVTVGTNGVLGGAGTISGDVLVNGALRPGVTTGTLTLGNTDLTFAGGANATFELDSGLNFDRVFGIDQLTLDGTFTVSLFGGYTPLAGDTFDLLDFASVNAAGFNVATDLLLPTLDGGLSWDNSAFVTQGILAVVPEPGSAAMLLLGLGSLALRRRRTR